MVTKEDGGGAADPDAGGKGNQPNNKNSNEPEKSDDKHYSKEWGNRLMDQKKATDRKNEELQTKLNEREAEDKSKKEAELKKQGKFKEALEAKEKDNKVLEDKLSAKEKQISDSRKLNAVVNSFDGSLKRSYWGLIDLDQVKLDEQGQPTEDSVKTLVTKFQEEYPEVLTKPGGPTLPNGNPKPPGGGTLTHAAWLKLPAKEMAKRMKDVEGFPKTS